MNPRIVIVGKAASGKDFLKNALSKNGLKCDVGYTTRPIRMGEKNGETYHYTPPEIFDEMLSAGHFKYDQAFNGWKYATSIDSWNHAQVFVMTPGLLLTLTKEELNECSVIYLNIPLEIRRERLLRRNDADSVERRLLTDDAD